MVCCDTVIHGKVNTITHHHSRFWIEVFKLDWKNAYRQWLLLKTTKKKLQFCYHLRFSLNVFKLLFASDLFFIKCSDSGYRTCVGTSWCLRDKRVTVLTHALFRARGQTSVVCLSACCRMRWIYKNILSQLPLPCFFSLREAEDSWLVGLAGWLVYVCVCCVCLCVLLYVPLFEGYRLTELAAWPAFLFCLYSGVSVCIKCIWSFMSSYAAVYFFWNEKRQILIWRVMTWWRHTVM